jgi:predicted MFS family arabinose efflux permease
VESNLPSPGIDKENTEGQNPETASPESAPPFRGPLGILLRFKTFEALRHRQYRLIWYGQIFASMGTWMDQVTRGWLIYELTDSALQLGLVRGIQAIPFLLLSPVAGSVADRYSRKMQVVLTQTADGILFAVMALLIFTGQIQPWHAYVTAVLMAVVQTFLQPARAALISDAVPPNNLTNAIGLNAVIFNAARSTGPAFAGVLIAQFGTGGAYAVQAIFFFMATIWTTQLRSSARSVAGSRGHSAHGESFGQSIIEGWKFSWRNETVRTALLVVMFVSLFIGPFTTLLPVFARDILHVGAAGQGLLLTAMGVGAVCSAVLIASFGDRLPRGILMLGSVMLYGFFTVMFAASPWFWLSLVLMVIIGLCHVHSHALVQTVIQSYSPSEFRGRTMAIFHMSQVVLTIGAMLYGALSSIVGAEWTVASMSAVGALIMIGISLALPGARFIR